ncbi:two-component hybrid sensor and regulator [Richelia sinica FACHB-800]|uniref:Two-component hybrid sensor and regulator n=2 Tax=Richelia TaxID=98443 RepID=A0A975TAR0_9NOST|nr:response regulator [Richelia sinica FACHB-800]QXE25149.1 two-component hybrid sensor and regulator [Richelia sinica FACHB-800]
MLSAKIMIVEDEVIIAMDLAEDLETLGYEVAEVVSSGEKAIEKVSEIQPDLILMDIMLKGEIDGITAAGEIAKMFDIPIVYLTAHTDKNTMLRAKSIKHCGYIIKPFDRQDLQKTIEKALTTDQCKYEQVITNSFPSEDYPCIKGEEKAKIILNWEESHI